MTIMRSQVLHNAATVWPVGQVEYDQQALHQPDGHRCDCSGYVDAALDIPPNYGGSWGGPNTVTLVTFGLISPIDANSLRPGDLVGRCGPGTDGDAGHVTIFTGWLNDIPNDNRYYGWQQTGGTAGPHHDVIDWLDGYQGYRYSGIVDDPAQPAAPFPMAYPPNVFGLITGPDDWHGGYYSWERPYVKRIQQALIRAGVVPGITNPASVWADGYYERPTAGAVERYQSAHGLTVDSLVGPQTWGDMAARGLLVGA